MLLQSLIDTVFSETESNCHSFWKLSHNKPGHVKLHNYRLVSASLCLDRWCYYSSCSWLSDTICLAIHLLPNLEPIHQSVPLIRYVPEWSPLSEHKYFRHILLSKSLLKAATHNPFPTISIPLQISAARQIEDKPPLADRRKTYLLKNSPD